MTIGIIANINKSRVQRTLCEFLAWLSERCDQILVGPELMAFIEQDLPKLKAVDEESFALGSDVVISMGGDGTMLAAARQLDKHQKPLLGINLGSLGFLADVSLDDLYPQMEALLRGEYTIERRLTLCARVQSGNREIAHAALNDVVVSRGGIPRMIQIEVRVNASYFTTYFTDGIILATPTGSTAYSLAAGGPIVMPSLDAMVLSPICPHTLTARPTVLSSDSLVEIILQSPDREAFVSVDGQVTQPIDCESRINIRRGSYDIQLIQFKNHNFFDVLRTKLQWGASHRK